MKNFPSILLIVEKSHRWEDGKDFLLRKKRGAICGDIIIKIFRIYFSATPV